MTVNKERVELLCQALESGEFEQGASYLLNDGKYCCLGVATEVALRYLGDIPDDVWNPTSREEVLHPAIQEWYGFPDIDPDILAGDVGDRELSPATVVNDSRNVSGEHAYDFREIAAAFRRTYVDPEVSP